MISLSNLLRDARFINAPTASSPNKTQGTHEPTVNGSGISSWPAHSNMSEASRIQNAADTRLATRSLPGRRPS